MALLPAHIHLNGLKIVPPQNSSHLVLLSQHYLKNTDIDSTVSQMLKAIFKKDVRPSSVGIYVDHRQ